MCPAIYLLFFSFAAAVLAGPEPMANKEIALMLRTGYSSDAVLAEVTHRRVLEPLDEQTKKSLLQFGAKEDLIAALENKTYLVSATEAQDAKRHEAEVAARRAAEIEQDRQYNTLLQATKGERNTPTAAHPPTGETPILDSLKDKLVHCRGGTIGRGNGSELEGKKYVAIYYSAHWCGPCRQFTPQLVEYYNRVVAEHPEFELIFVSFDRSRFDWETYIQEAQMPWLAVDYDQLADLTGLKQLGGNSIPSLLVVDSDSRLVASSYDGDKYVGPKNALAALDRIFTSPGQPQVARVH
jgi:nucleoredoxin